MDQKKVGAFLKELRKEKGLTQEQAAAKFNTSNRTVSRWETGFNMPDISMLVEISDFYGVDVRELIDGERRKDNMDKEITEVAEKMADYAENEKTEIFRHMGRISTIGSIVCFILLIVQFILTGSGHGNLLMLIGLAVIFIIMIVLAVYAHGSMIKIAGNKNFHKAVRILLIALAVVGMIMVLRTILIVLGVMIFEGAPSNTKSMEEYDKSAITDTYGGDLGSAMMLFPDDLSKPSGYQYRNRFHTGLFDTDCYIWLYCTYTPEAYEEELERLMNTECTLNVSGTDITQQVIIDETSYRLPAVVAVDGCDDVYEYALFDDEAYTITYVLLSYPEFFEDLFGKDEELERDMKLDMSSYSEEATPEEELQRFNIYGYYIDSSLVEYGDQ